MSREKRGAPERTRLNKSVLPTILIVTEGMKTEPNYFRSFPISSLEVECIIKGAGRITESVVEYAKKLNEDNDINADIVWCVFDSDDFVSFDQAISKAKKYGFKVAYSVESFELWYVLHFQYLTAQIKRNSYVDILKEKLKDGYAKNSERMYELLLDKQSIAIKNAKKLEQYHDEYETIAKSKRRPSTTVFKLVEELNQYIKE